MSNHQFTNPLVHQLLRLFMRRMLPAEPAELAHFEPFRRFLLVLRRAVVTTLALGAGHRNDVSHNRFSDLVIGKWGNRVFGLFNYPITRLFNYPIYYSTISVTVPAPTVRPPSRM